MRPNLVKRALRDGKTVCGTMIFEFNTPGVARIAAAAGTEFLLFDMEHTGFDLESIKMLLASCGGLDIVPFVRVPATQYHFIARTLDMGAMGIMVPMVESAEQARVIVESAKYPPAGRRGAAFNVAHDDYRGGSLLDKMTSANEEVLLIAQIETKTGLQHVDDIAAVPGVDVLWVGQTDLTSSLGIPGQFQHPEFLAALDRVAQSAQKHGKSAAYMPLSLDEAADVHRRGFHLLAYSGDIWIYQQGLRQGLKEMRLRTRS